MKDTIRAIESECYGPDDEPKDSVDQDTRDEPLMPLLVPGVVNYSHDMENRLTHIDGVPNSFDANGNLTSQSGITYSWDYEDRLLSQDDGAVVTTYDYDGLGERFQRTEGGTTTRFVLDTNTPLTNVIAEVNTSNTITAYNIYGLGLIARTEVGGSTRYYHYDSRGSTIALTDGGETVTDSYLYDPFGLQLGITGFANNPYRFLGKHGILHDAGGINYIRARYYDTANARFISKDRATPDEQNTQSINRYIYSLNNPVVLVDVNGEFAQILVGAGVGAIVGLAYTAFNDVVLGKDVGADEYVINMATGAIGGAVVTVLPTLGLTTLQTAAIAGASSSASGQVLTGYNQFLRGEEVNQFDPVGYSKDIVRSVLIAKAMNQVGKPSGARPYPVTKYFTGKNIDVYWAQQAAKTSMKIMWNETQELTSWLVPEIGEVLWGGMNKKEKH